MSIAYISAFIALLTSQLKFARVINISTKNQLCFLPEVSQL